MPERFGHGEWPDPALMPGPQRALHRAQMAQVRAQRERETDRSDLDEQGRPWPGLVDEADPNTNP